MVGKIGQLAITKLSSALLLTLAMGSVLSAGPLAIADAHADDAVTVKLGVVTSLSPPGAYQLGQEAKEAAETFVKWNNAQNSGVKFDLVGIVDDKGDPATGQAGVRKLLAQGAQAFVGDMSSAIATAEMPLMEQSGAIYILGASWANELTSPTRPSVFRIGAYNTSLGTNGIVPYLKDLHQKRGINRVAVLAEDSAFGEDIAKVLKEGVANDIPDMKLDVGIFPATSSDVTAQLLALKKNDPQVLIILSVTQAENLAINQAHEVGLVPPAEILAAYDYPEYADFWKVVGANGLGVSYVKQEAPNATLNAEGKAFADAVGHRPSIWAMWVWDACRALQKAALQSKSGDSANLAKAMESESFDGATGPVSFSVDAANYHNRKSIPTYILQTTKQGSTGSDAKVVFSTVAQ